MFVGWLDLANTINFKSANLLHVHNNIQIHELLVIRTQGIVNRLAATCSTMVRRTIATTDGETTRGHWLEHHEHFASSVATLTKMETAAQSCGPTHGHGR